MGNTVHNVLSWAALIFRQTCFMAVSIGRAGSTPTRVVLNTLKVAGSFQDFLSFFFLSRSIFRRPRTLCGLIDASYCRVLTPTIGNAPDILSKMNKLCPVHSIYREHVQFSSFPSIFDVAGFCRPVNTSVTAILLSACTSCGGIVRNPLTN